jgi:hypothetical protein
MAEELLPTDTEDTAAGTFMLATILYYGTVSFCKKHISSVRKLTKWFRRPDPVGKTLRRAPNAPSLRRKRKLL